MEPEKNTPEEKIDQATLSNLKDEGIEVETSSRRVEENEFSPEMSASGTSAPERTLDGETKEILAEIAGPKAATEAKPEQAPVPNAVPKPPLPPRAPVMPAYRAAPSANDPSIRQLRTFKMDAEEAVRYNSVSAADIAIAERKKRESTPIEYEDGRESKLPLALAILAVLVILAGGGAYLYLRTTSVPQTAQPVSNIRSIIAYNKIVTVPAGTSDIMLNKIASSAKDVSSTVGDVIFIALPDIGTTTRQASSALALAGTKAPEKLVRSLTNEYMFGIHVFDGRAPFIILKTSFFQNAFPGMLEWEKDMRNGLLPFIRLGRPNVEAISANTDVFRDRVIANKDVRELDDASGVPIILYTFVDKDTILITTDEKSLRELLDKILTVRVIQ